MRGFLLVGWCSSCQPSHAEATVSTSARFPGLQRQLRTMLFEAADVQVLGEAPWLLTGGRRILVADGAMVRRV
jgi:hypothetical protein